MATIRTSRDGSVIDYRLNWLGIRVWKEHCCLIAFSGQEWRALGAMRRLPLRIPQVHELGQSWVDELAVTAYQLQMELQDSDFAAVVTKRADIGGHAQAPQETNVTH